MKTMLKILAAFAVTIGFSAPVMAEEVDAGATDEDTTYKTQDVDGGQAVTFKDDLLDGAGMDGNAAILRVRPQAARLVLIRPRLHFVNELLKSAESI